MAGRAPVAVVGAGVKAPGGTTVDELWASLSRGRSTAAPYHDERWGPAPRLLACSVEGFDPAAYVTAAEARRMDRSHLLAIGAAQDAMDGVVGAPRPPPERCAVVCGVGYGVAALVEQQVTTLFDRGLRGISPLAIPMAMPSSVDAHLSLRFGFAGPCSTVSTACASGADAIGQGVELLRRGAADLVLAGGVDALLTYTIVSLFLRMEVMSANVAQPERASRPFDVDRDGFVMGEGAGFVVLQRAEDAEAAGRDTLGLVTGYGACAEAHHLVAPDPDGAGARRAMALALDDAGTAPAAISHVNAHGTSTRLNDLTEARAVTAVFGEDSAAGHLGEGHDRAPHRRLGSGRVHRRSALVAGTARAARRRAADARSRDHARRRAGRAEGDRTRPVPVELVRLRRSRRRARAQRPLSSSSSRQRSTRPAASRPTSNRTGARTSCQYVRSGPRSSTRKPSCRHMALTGADIIPQATPNPRRRTSRYNPPSSRTKVLWLASWCDGATTIRPTSDHAAPRLDHQRARLLGGQRAGREHEATGAHRGRSVPAEDVDRGGVERVVLAPAVQLVGAEPTLG